MSESKADFWLEKRPDRFSESFGWDISEETVEVTVFAHATWLYSKTPI